MAAAGPILQGAGMVAQAVGTIREGNAQKAAADYNAQQAETQAGQERTSAYEESRRFRMQSRKDIGSQRANYAASGVSLEGSPLDILEESAANAELDALTIKYKGESRANALESTAKLDRERGKQARDSAYLGAATGLLMSGGKAASAGGGGAGGAG